jgi:hypothetical protein
VIDDTHRLQYECAVYRGTDGDISTARFLALSLGLRSSPMLAAIVDSNKEGLTSQIAVKLSLESILEGAFDIVNANLADSSTSDLGHNIVRAAFQKANQRVYEYAHRMVAGGKISARGQVFVYSGDRICIGSVGAF